MASKFKRLEVGPSLYTYHQRRVVTPMGASESVIYVHKQNCNADNGRKGTHKYPSTQPHAQVNIIHINHDIVQI